MMSCSFVTLLSSLLGLFGLAGIGHHYYRHGHGALGWHGHHHGHQHGHFGHHEHSAEMQKKCDEGFQIIACHRRCGEDKTCHDSCPLPQCPKMAAKVKGIIECNMECGSDFACRKSCNRPVQRFVEMCSNLKKPDLQQVKPPPAQFIVSKFRICQKECAGDAECMAKCPKPFWMGFKKTCEEAIPIMQCHRACGHDHGCHQQCPLPSCPHMKAQAEETLKCHGRCQDQECHHMCPKPMKKMLMKCQAFEEAQQCHSRCTDFKCHHDCPKARLWKFFGQNSKHLGFHHGDFHHHRNFHHRNFHHGDFHHGGFHHDHHADFGVINGLPTPPAVIPMLRGSMPQLIDCATKCQNDAPCVQKCSAEWNDVQKTCMEISGIMDCHQKCYHDSTCHSQCPRPTIQWLDEKIEASMACHHGCADADCHHKCPDFFGELKEKCAILGPTPGTWQMLPTEVTV
eukprot:CAMPEP_0114694462 /NCGR_PEP_ID=MMETSP0191-20121206/70200_1 /TAXON_ID=126664 /ORGANISM="Sorites sp." /LENGTH=453 /DNA_ID=CAMNT_0001989365 /DNA_START=27 /DNA_END=1388 /DNA_ORIENTATION=+